MEIIRKEDDQRVGSASVAQQVVQLPPVDTVGIVRNLKRRIHRLDIPKAEKQELIGLLDKLL